MHQFLFMWTKHYFGPPILGYVRTEAVFIIMSKLLNKTWFSHFLLLVQFDTIYKIRTFQSNYAHAGANGTGVVFMGMDWTNSRVSNSATNTIWFSRFMQGCHKIMGDLNLPDKAIDCFVIRGCFEIAKCLWEGNEFDPYAQEQAAMAICIIIAGYYGGL